MARQRAAAQGLRPHTQGSDGGTLTGHRGRGCGPARPPAGRGSRLPCPPAQADGCSGVCTAGSDHGKVQEGAGRHSQRDWSPREAGRARRLSEMLPCNLIKNKNTTNLQSELSGQGPPGLGPASMLRPGWCSADQDPETEGGGCGRGAEQRACAARFRGALHKSVWKGRRVRDKERRTGRLVALWALEGPAGPASRGASRLTAPCRWQLPLANRDPTLRVKIFESCSPEASATLGAAPAVNRCPPQVAGPGCFAQVSAGSVLASAPPPAPAREAGIGRAHPSSLHIPDQEENGRPAQTEPSSRGRDRPALRARGGVRATAAAGCTSSALSVPRTRPPPTERFSPATATN